MHLLINDLDSGMLIEESVASRHLFGCEFFGCFAQGREGSPLPVDLRSDGAHELDAVLIDQANRMEPVGYDLGVWEPLAGDPSVGAGQVDTDEPDAFPAFKCGEEAGEVFFTSAGMHFKDFVVFKITEGGAKALTFVQGMFVDSQI